MGTAAIRALVRVAALAAALAAALLCTVLGTPVARAATIVTTFAELQTAANAGGTVQLGADITSSGAGLVIPSGGNVTLILGGFSLTVTGGTSQAGIQTTGSTLMIDGPGTVAATGNGGGAGIGGIPGSIPAATTGTDGGTLTLTGATVDATGSTYIFNLGGYGGAGIGGGGLGGSGGTVTINGGSVTATGGTNGAGIGGGGGKPNQSLAGGTGATVTVNGGSVSATGGASASGIGGGFNGPGGAVVIHSGTVVATTTAGLGGSAIGPGALGTAFGSLSNNGSLTLAGEETIPSTVTPANGWCTNQANGTVTLTGPMAGGGTCVNSGVIDPGSQSLTATVAGNSYVLSYNVNADTGATVPATQHVYGPTLKAAHLAIAAQPSGYVWMSAATGGAVVTATTALPTVFGRNSSGPTAVTLYLRHVPVKPTPSVAPVLAGAQSTPTPPRPIQPGTQPAAHASGTRPASQPAQTPLPPIPSSGTLPAAAGTLPASVVTPPAGSHSAKPSALTHSLPSIWQVIRHPERLALALGMGLVWTLLLVFATGSMEKTLKTRYTAWTAIIQRRFPRALHVMTGGLRLGGPTQLLGLLALLAANVAIVGFVDPGFGANATSVRLSVSILAANLLGVYLPYRLTAEVSRRLWSAPAAVHPAPWGLVICGVGVGMSRLIGFIPGLLTGSTIRFDQSRASVRERVRMQRLRTGMTLGLALVFWIGATGIPGAGSSATLCAHDACVTGAVIALTSTLVELLPLSYFAGGLLYTHARRSWAILLTAAVFGFLLVVVPQPHYWLYVGARETWWITIAAVVGATTALIMLALHRHDARRPADVDRWETLVS